MVVLIGLILGTGICALLAIRAPRLLHSAIWLAAASALTSVVLYLLGAPEVAVIELSVGAGLVTVLLVVAISMVRDEEVSWRSLIPRWLVVTLAGGAILLLAVLMFVEPVVRPAVTEPSFSVMLWQERSPDVLLQAVLLFVGALTVLGLLAEPPQREAVAVLEPEVEEDVEEDAPEGVKLEEELPA